jgi:hypothetical protein
MADTNFGLGSLFQEEGPGRTSAPRVLPQIDNSLIRKIDDQRSFLDYFQEEDNLGERISELFAQPEQVFGAYQRPEDGRVVQFGLPTEFNEEELLSEYNILQEMPPVSQLKDRKAVADVAKRLESLPENDPIFAESPLDQLATDIDETLAQLQPKKEVKSSIEETLRRKEADLDPTVSQDEIEQAAMAGLNDYLEAVRGAGPDTKVKDLDEYKKKFAEATGIDISGKVDKSHALMSFGLALMQNKAGKGFNIGKMLGAVGEAGQAALPALEKARERSRQDGIAAGKFALEMRSADEAKALAAREKAMERTDYFVVPKFENVKGLLASLAQGEGKRKSLSKYELDKLIKNPEFASQFEVLPGSVWSSVVSEAMKTPEAKEYFDTTPRKMSLITGDDDPMYMIDVFYGLPNQAKRGQVVSASDAKVDAAYRALQKRFKSNQTNKEKFINLQTMSDEGAVNVFSTLLDTVDSAASAFGVNVSEGANPNEKMKAILTELQAKQANNILGEGGKNTSDFERSLVKSIVGDKTLFSNPDLLEFKLAKLYNDVVTGEENKILEGLTNLDQVSGEKISSYFGDGELTEAERKSMNADLKTLGVVK